MGAAFSFGDRRKLLSPDVGPGRPVTHRRVVLTHGGCVLQQQQAHGCSPGERTSGWALMGTRHCWSAERWEVGPAEPWQQPEHSCLCRVPQGARPAILMAFQSACALRAVVQRVSSSPFGSLARARTVSYVPSRDTPSTR